MKTIKNHENITKVIKMDEPNKDILDFTNYLAAQRGLSKNTINSYTKDLISFFDYLESEHLDLEHLQRYHIRGYLAHLKHNKLTATSINRHISALKTFIKYKKRFGYVDRASILEIESLRTNKYLPNFLFYEEFDKLISFDLHDKQDYRDRAIFQLIFATGMRVSEVVSLNLSHLNAPNNEIHIIGKGNKERIVIYGQSAKTDLHNYLKYRQDFHPVDNALFVGTSGKRLSDRSIRYVLDKRIEEVALAKHISPHSLRHSFATLMIQNGANIRTVQTLLGHSKLSTTQIYTHLGIDQLKNACHKYHPHG